MVINLVKNRYKYLAIFGVTVVFSLGMLFFKELNFGIDMTGGTQTEYSYEGNIVLTDVQAGVKKISEDFNTKNSDIINATSVYSITGESKIVVEIGFNSNVKDEVLEKNKTEFKTEVTNYLNSVNNTFKLDKYTNIGKSFGDYIKNTAIITLAIAVLAISIYIAYAFSGNVSGVPSFHFALVTGITLLHDVLVPTGFYIFISGFFPEFKIDTYFITALLTILGYSINDTIVIFDRIRFNLKQFGGKTKQLAEIVDLSINETLKRSIYTSLTLELVLVAIFFAGPESIKGFILIMLLGTVFGTFSSIFLASPLLYEMNKNKKLEVYKKKVVKVEDKIVV